MSAGPSVAIALVGVVLLLGCAPDDEPESDAGSAVVVTTSTMPPAPPTTPAASDEPPASTAPTAVVDTTADAATTTSTTTTSTTTTVPVVGDPVITTEVVASFDRPVDLVARPGDEALFVVEQPGRVVRFDGAPVVVADLTDRTGASGERGLLGLEFAPDGDRAYANYTNGSGDTVIAEYPVAADGTLDVASERVVLVVSQPYGNHNAGDLAFGPDGMLYIPLGDGGSANDPQRRASDPRSLLGSLLRIDPTPTGERPYTIPADNPFANGSIDGVEGAPEVWAWGLRNPWKIDFDPVTGELWIADVGQNRLEEVNVVGPVDGTTAGRAVDFGWSAFEGTERFNSDVPDDGRATGPVLVYQHGRDGCSISGGAPYRGTAIAELAPAYVYSDYCSGIVWALDLAGGRNLELLDGFSEVTAIRRGPDGELYLLEGTGDVHLVVGA